MEEYLIPFSKITIEMLNVKISFSVRNAFRKHIDAR